MSNRLLVPKHLRFPTPSIIIRRNRLILPGLVPAFPVRMPSKPPVVPGSVSYTTPGSSSFIVPEFNTLTVTVKGGGGGGGGADAHSSDFAESWTGTNGSTGGNSSFNGSVIGNGGGGGLKGTIVTDDAGSTNGGNGSNGTASGGDTNTTGGGSSGGTGSTNPSWNPGHGGTGGAGGRAVKTYASGSLTVGASITVIVGGWGAKGVCTYTSSANGNDGSAGSVVISWS